ncbi:MAG: nucleotidyltransferase family protein [Bacteroidota bacterium]
MTPWTPIVDDYWPSPDHELLLRASLLDRPEAEAAWEAWLATNDIEDVDMPTYFIFPTLYHNLQRVGLQSAVVTKLSGVYRFTWAKNEVALRSLAEVVRVLDAEAIPTVALKGAALLRRHYRDPGARMMNDVDVLVRDGDAIRALTALQEAGWTPETPIPDARHLPFLHAIPVQHAQHVEADIHWRPFLVDAPLGAEAALFDRAETAPAVGTRAPDATDLLMMVCVHGRKPDMHSTCRWIADAVTIAQSAEIDWGRLGDDAQALGVLLPLRDALTKVAELFPASVPEAALAAMWEVPATAADRRRYHQLMHESRAYRRLRDLAATHWWRYTSGTRSRGLRPTPAGAVRYGLEHYRRVWGLDRAAQVPGYAAAELGRHLRRVAREGGPTAEGEIELVAAEANG